MNLVSFASRSLLGAAVALFVAAAPAATFTVATFADPAVDQTTPLFTLDGTQFTGGWTGNNLTLLTPGIGVLPDIANAHFSLTPLIATSIGPGFWTLTGGTINFNDASNTVFTIQFEAATLASNVGFGASDLALQNVVFTVPGHSELVYMQERFAFSFANDVVTPSGYTWTAAFTSSAAIPEPASIAMLALGLAGSLLRRR